MTELNLNISAAPELRTMVPGGADLATRPEAVNPARPDSPENPFAVLLAGFLQGTQPQTQPAVPVDPDPALATGPEELPDSGADLPELLALPVGASPLPALTDTTTNLAATSGKTLPLTGNPLPQSFAAPQGSAVEAQGQKSDPAPASGPAAPAEGRPRIYLADLALSRPLEAPSASTPSAPVPETQSPLALADRSFQPKGARTDPATPRTQPLPLLAATGDLAQTAVTAPAAIGADELALRLNTTDLLRAAVAPGAGINFVPAQLAAFATGNDGTGPAATASFSGTGTADTPTATPLGRLGSTTLPALQPLGTSQSFATGLADRLLTTGGPGTHTARLQLHPEHLGELKVEIQIDDGSAQVWFGTTSSQARDAIQASLTHLKELFADQGLALTRTQVDSGSSQMGNQGFDQQRRMAPGNPFETPSGWRNDSRSGSSPLATLLPAARPSSRLVDAWA